MMVNPTLEEAFGLVNPECLACGTPIVSYKTGGCIEIINPSVEVLVEKGNYKELINAIQYVSNNKNRYKQNILRQYVYNNYNAETNYKKYLKLYSDLIKYNE